MKKTSEISKIVGVSKRTLQFYDDEGMIKIEEKIQKLEKQKRFISLIIVKGLPQIPDENSDVTHKSRLAELRKGCTYE